VSQTSPIVSVSTPTGPLVDIKTGLATFAFLKWLQNIGQLINKVFDNTGAISPDAIPFPTSTSLGGIVTAGPSANQWVNAIDGTGTPQLSQPSFQNLSGTATPAQIPALSALSGSVNPAQVPPLSDLNGAVTASQVPPLSVLSGQITAGQIPAGLGFGGTIVTAKLTVGGANGSMTFSNGFLVSQVPAT